MAKINQSITPFSLVIGNDPSVLQLLFSGKVPSWSLSRYLQIWAIISFGYFLVGQRACIAIIRVNMQSKGLQASEWNTPNFERCAAILRHTSSVCQPSVLFPLMTS